ncbi:MAG: hypothetical protein RL154_966 [Pseudomonadota bacterium]|jgi:diguanylate cyclase (GGDEF)-like protein/PAS domain S-box-containing protein
MLLEMLKGAVVNSGKFRGFYASSYAQAKELLAERPFFAAIVDLELPDCNTGDAIDLTLSYNIPTIALTGLMNEALRDKILEKPIVDYITKESQESINNALIIAENLLIYEHEKVLVVDDSKAARAILEDMLTSLTFSVKEAVDAESAIEILKTENDFCAILIDYKLPHMNGMQLMHEIRRMDLKKIPVMIGITSYSDPKTRLGLLKAGANDVFLKPFVKEEFNAKLANALRLAESQTKMQKYVEMVEKFIMIIDTNASGIIVSVSQAFIDASGYTTEEIIGKKINSLIAELPEYNELSSCANTHEKVHLEVKNYKKDGQPYWLSLHCEPIVNKINEHLGCRIILQDITAKKYAQKMAMTDKLTGISNRRKIEDDFSDVIEKARLANEPFGLIIADIDHFKHVNDKFGHQTGDDVLKGVAEILATNIRKVDVIGRWGGEEFVILAKGANLTNTVNLAQKLRVAIARQEFEVAGNLTASFGVSAYTEGDTQSSLFARADEALYQAKASGRNAVGQL